MASFQKTNTLAGWAVFAVAAAVYVRTVEPTVSFWDCGEFVAAAHKLLVGHPPGAPFFLLVARVFTAALAHDPTQVAYWMNVLSALCSAFTVLFLFWTITRLGRKVAGPGASPWSLLAAGAAGSLAYAFSDSFWFSAVESEVYALSSLFTAFVVWAMLRWEQVEDAAAANRWLILIAYAIGLSVGTHLLNLVALPALALIYYFKKYSPTFWGGAAALGAGGVLVFACMTVMRTGLPGLAGRADILFVNALGLPFGSGAVAFAAVFLGVLGYGIRVSARRGRVVLNTALLGFAFVLIGYSSYTLLVVRAGQRVPFNLSDPKDAPGFMYYLNMEQYGAGRPLVYGPNFTTQVSGYTQGGNIYVKGDARYESYSRHMEPVYDPRGLTLFPRLYSTDEARRHPQLYRQITGLRDGQKPTLAHQLSYFFTHQAGHFYARYFLWNFAGRDSDEQGAGWLATFSPKASLPPDLALNRGHNRFYGLPLLLGVLGLAWLLRRNRQVLLVTGVLFFMTGLALVLYLNPPPVEPRERDYIYVGSFYVFAIWMGMGALAAAGWAGRLAARWRPAAGLFAGTAAAASCLAVPVLMAVQNWDDHDRSGRYMALDSARNMLESCAPGAILFTTGDNDTYPLLYAQEVENIRPDVRVVVSQFMGTDWYIDHLKQDLGRTPALPVSLAKKNYVSHVNNQVLYYENPSVKDGMDLREYLRLLRDDSPALKVTLDSGETLNTLPTHRLHLPHDKAALLRSGQIPEPLQPLLTDRMTIELPKTHLYKDALVWLDVLAHNEWRRPVYFTTPQLPRQYNLMEYTQLEGVVCRLLPVKVPGADQGFVNSPLAYRNLMHKSRWRGLADPAVYHDETCRGERLVYSRLAFLELAQQLMAENQHKKARQVLMESLAVMPNETLRDDRLCSLYVAPLLRAGAGPEARRLASALAHRADRNLAYYHEQAAPDRQTVGGHLAVLHQLAAAFREAAPAEAPAYEALLQKHLAGWRQ